MNDTEDHPLNDPEYRSMVAEAIGNLNTQELVYLVSAWAYLCPGSFQEGLARLPEFV